MENIQDGHCRGKEKVRGVCYFLIGRTNSHFVYKQHIFVYSGNNFKLPEKELLV